MSRVELNGRIVSMAYLSPTHNELRLKVKVGTATITVVISDKQTLDFVKSMTLDSEISITGRLGSESTVHASEVIES